MTAGSKPAIEKLTGPYELLNIKVKSLSKIHGDVRSGYTCSSVMILGNHLSIDLESNYALNFASKNKYLVNCINSACRQKQVKSYDIIRLSHI